MCIRDSNTGVLNSDLELFFCVDSDDIIAEDCVEKHLKRWNQVRNNERVAGIISLKGDLEGNPLGTYFPEGLDCVSRKLLYGKMKFKEMCIRDRMKMVILIIMKMVR